MISPSEVTRVCIECENRKPLVEFFSYSNGCIRPKCKICKRADDRRKYKIRVESRSFEERKCLRLRSREAHKRAHKAYRERLRAKNREEQIIKHKQLYSSITKDLEDGLFKNEIRLKYDLSTRFLKRLLKYKGNCYKTETVIDRIKPGLDKYYGSSAEREYSWSWLKSPLTGTRMRVDLYYPGLNLAVEFNGPQHYREIGYGNLKEVQVRDKAKYKLLTNHAIDLRIITNEMEILK